MSYEYDLIVIGGGSGGIACAKRSAVSHGKKVALIEKARLGGTCVNVGCVPKKVMFLAASINEILQHDAAQYGFQNTSNSSFDFPTLRAKRDKYVARLNGIYGNGLKNANVDNFVGSAKMTDAHSVEITLEDGTTKTITASNVLLAPGGRPMWPKGEGIAENAIDSDGFFELEELPSKAVVVGAGYIAVELAGVMNALGTQVHLVLRKHKALRTFDDDISDILDAEMLKSGITIHRNTQGVKSIAVENGKKTVHLVEGDPIPDVDVVLMAPGRIPNVEGLGLEEVGVKLNKKGYIDVDEFQNTSVEGVYAVGDVCGVVELTPMAIAAGRRLSDRLFQDESTAKIAKPKVNYEGVPTVVFSHPPIGGCGLTEKEAETKYGKDNIKVYKSKFANLFYGIFDVEPDDKPKTFMKVITAGEEEQVVGMHVIGMGADEMMQGFGVAMKMGCTKADLDSCVAIHPTAAEEFVTMGTWGTAPPVSGAEVSDHVIGGKAKEPKLRSNM